MPDINKKVLANEFFLKNTGKSMMPILLPGDIIRYKKTPFGKLKLDDIILVNKNGTLFTHRIIYRSDKYLITRGDNNFLPDAKIYPKNVLAKSIYYKRGGKTLDIENIYFLQSSLYYKEIIKLNDYFREAGIDFVFLKGSPVYHFYMKAHPRRLYNDCDILLDYRHLKPALEIMKKNGYRSCDSPLSGFQKKIKNHDVALCFGKLINGFVVIIDIHFDVDFLMTQVSNLDCIFPSHIVRALTTNFLQKKRKILVKEHYFYILSPAHMVLNLCLHFYKHNLRGFDRIYFISRVIRKEKIKNAKLFDEIVEEINKFHLENFIYPVFLIISRFFPDTQISRYINKINPQKDKIDYIKKITENDIFVEEPRITAGIARFKNLFFLSPNPNAKKLLVFINPQVLLAVLTLTVKKFWRLFAISKVS